ncbi:unnamed protein product [Darwinula stevensoni]|uniref:Core Histone H2A/H2B/H3 domain-containing protein n=1 Tax=Darwinula stevensoni TaxID=69355 RepID=A0A7R9A9V5_9CRUS|nr:unnamed protein product [Darwinula stevensoni]CAG0897802.1 unnamed protein product [Darwinula stevensoni]
MVNFGTAFEGLTHEENFHITLLILALKNLTHLIVTLCILGSTVSQGAPRRKSRKQVYSVALTEIHRLQRSTKPLIPRLPFYRLVKEISHDQMSEVQFYTVEAIECLREATEIFLVGYLEDSYRCTIHGNRVTLMEKDLILCADIRARYEPNVFTSRPGGRIAY